MGGLPACFLVGQPRRGQQRVQLAQVRVHAQLLRVALDLLFGDLYHAAQPDRFDAYQLLLLVERLDSNLPFGHVHVYVR